MTPFPCVITNATPDYNRPFVVVKYEIFQSEEEMTKSIEKMIVDFYGCYIEENPSIKNISDLQEKLYRGMFMDDDLLTAKFFDSKTNKWEDVDINRISLSAVSRVRSDQKC